jgi:hypothetical protein
LLLGRYYGALLIEQGRVPREEALDVVLRMEQICAYVRYNAHGVEGDIRGIERVKRYLEEHGARPYIETGPRGRILSDQRIYGLWGLYSVPARASELLPDGAVGVMPAAVELIERAYRPKLREVEGPLLDLLARGGRFEVSKRSKLYLQLALVLPELFRPVEAEFYAHYLRDALEVKRDDVPRGRQQLAARLLRELGMLEGGFDRVSVQRLQEAAAEQDEGLGRAFARILALEALLAPAASVFDLVLTRQGQRVAKVAATLREQWGARVPNLDPQAFQDLLAEIADASTREQGAAMQRCHQALASGDYAAAIEALLTWNAHVMQGRRSAPWVRLGPAGSLDVRYRGVERMLPDGVELETLWDNGYYLDSLAQVTRQLEEAG